MEREELLAAVKIAKASKDHPASWFDGYTKLTGPDLEALARKTGVWATEPEAPKLDSGGVSGAALDADVEITDEDVAAAVAGDSPPPESMSDDGALTVLRAEMAELEGQAEALEDRAGKAEGLLKEEQEKAVQLAVDLEEALGVVREVTEIAREAVAERDKAVLAVGRLTMQGATVVNNVDIRGPVTVTREPDGTTTVTTPVAQSPGEASATATTPRSSITEVPMDERWSLGPEIPCPEGALVNPDNGYPARVQVLRNAETEGGKLKRGTVYRGERAWELWDEHNDLVQALPPKRTTK